MKLLQCVVFHTNLSDNTSPFAIRIKYTLHHGPLNNPERTKSGDTGDPVVIESAFCSYDVSAAFIVLKNITYGKRGVPKFTFGNLIPRHYLSLESDIEKRLDLTKKKRFLFQYLNTCILFRCLDSVLGVPAIYYGTCAFTRWVRI